MKGTFTLGIVLVLLLACVGAVSAVTVANGGFETPTVSGSFTNDVTAADLGGWNVVHIDHIGSYWAAAEGSQSIDLAGYFAEGTISQIITNTDPTKTYVLSFEMAGNPEDGPTIKQVQVWWDTHLIATRTFDITGKSKDTKISMGWKPETVSLPKPTGTSAELKFIDVSGENPHVQGQDTAWGTALDNIVVEEEDNNVPVPEFPSIALPAALIVGLIGAVLIIQKSKDN